MRDIILKLFESNLDIILKGNNNIDNRMSYKIESPRFEFYEIHK